MPDCVSTFLELTRLGVLGENVDVGMIKKIVAGTQEEDLFRHHSIQDFSNLPFKIGKIIDKASPETKRAVTGVMAAGRKVKTGFENAYSGVDNFWKVYAYEAELFKLKQAYEHDRNAPSLAEMKKEAAHIVRETMPTYSEAFSLLEEGKWYTNLAAPFLKFKAEVLRTSYGTVKQALKEAHSSNPVIRRNGIYRIASFTLVTALVPAILGTVTKAMFDYDDDDEETFATLFLSGKGTRKCSSCQKQRTGTPGLQISRT